MRGVHNLRHRFGHLLRAARISVEEHKARLWLKSQEITTHCSMPDIARLIQCVERTTEERDPVILRLVRTVAYTTLYRMLGRSISASTRQPLKLQATDCK